MTKKHLIYVGIFAYDFITANRLSKVYSEKYNIYFSTIQNREGKWAITNKWSGYVSK